MKTLSEFNEYLQSIGRYTFERNEALEKLKISSNALNLAAHKLSIKEKLVSLRNGFYLIIPAEYLHSVPPPTWYIDDLMNYLKQPYYVGLLSAGAFLGAAHHQPQEFQVVTNKTTRNFTIKNSRHRFFVKANLQLQFTQKKSSPTGKIIVSGPELTAVDLLRYASKIGGLDLVGTVLNELAEVMDAKTLVKVAREYKSLATVQRLGFLLEYLKFKSLAEPLSKWVQQQKPSMVVLRTDTSRMSGKRNLNWNVIVNDELEIET